MAAVASQSHSLEMNHQSPTVPNGTSNDHKSGINGVSATRGEPTTAGISTTSSTQQSDSSGRAPPPKKAGTKKTTDPSETSKLLAAKISQLELDRAGEKDQEAEIGGSQLAIHPCGYFLSSPGCRCFPSSLLLAPITLSVLLLIRAHWCARYHRA